MKRVVIITLILIGGIVQWAKASTGQLEILNRGDDLPQSGLFTMDHWPGSSEGYNPGDPDFDTDYNPLFTPSGWKAKIISEVEEHELEYDSRPLDNNSVSLMLSLHSQSGNAVTVSSNNYLQLQIDPLNNGWDFGTKPITLQEYDPCDPNVCYPEYDVRKVINLDNGIISLPDLNGTYNSEEVYAWFKLSFDKYHTDLNGDQKTKFEDFAIFANSWQRTGITLTDRQNPVDLGAYADYDLEGDVDTNDLCIFAGRWLWDANYPNTW